MYLIKGVKYAGVIIAIMGIILFLLSFFSTRIKTDKDSLEEYEIYEDDEQNLVEIFSFEDLYNFVQLFYKQDQTYYVVSLNNNIIIPDGQGDLSIGTWEKPFRGKFLGNNYKISGIDIYGTENVTGFFNCIDSASIEYLHIEGNVYSLDSIGTGGIVGTALQSKIDHCSFTGTVKAKSGSVGGITGNNHAMISNCQSEAKISGGCDGSYGEELSGFFGRFGSGGIAGNNEGIISYSNNMGQVSSDAGGIVGWNNGTIVYCNNIADGNGGGLVDVNAGTISYCSNTGNMRGNAVAGISVTCTKQGHIKRCINLGIMEGRYAGGLVAFLGQGSDMGEGYIEDSISVVKKGIKAINRIHAGTAKAIRTISHKLAEDEKNIIEISIKSEGKIDIEEIYISLLNNKKKSMIQKSIFLFLVGMILWKFEYLKMFYKKVIYQPYAYKRLSNGLKKNIRNEEEIEFGHIEFEDQIIQMKWNILVQEGKNVWLISSENICCHVYHEKYHAICWYESSIFHWLNKEFYETCFTEIEKKFLDRDITLLDRASAEKFLPSRIMRQSKNSKCANRQGALSKGVYGYWWLKNYDETDHPSFVTADGGFSNQGIRNTFDGICVKPVVCIHLEEEDGNIR